MAAIPSSSSGGAGGVDAAAAPGVPTWIVDEVTASSGRAMRESISYADTQRGWLHMKGTFCFV
jgi:hypothetical protein